MSSKRLRVFLIVALVALQAVFACACSGSVEMRVKNPASGFGAAITPQEKPSDLPGDGGGDGGTGTTPDVNWTPDILDRDEQYVEGTYDDSVKYDYSATNLKIRAISGACTEAQGTGTHPDLTVTSGLTIGLGNVAFPYGTFSCDVTTVANGDSGIIFCQDATVPSFWEDGANYYFYFISVDGRIYLSKVVEGKWSAIESVAVTFDRTQSQNLKVVLKNGRITCYFNGELIIDLKEKKPLTGTGFGIRAATSGAVFANIAVTNDYLY